MYFSRSFIASALLGFAAATTSSGAPAASTAVVVASESTAAVAVPSGSAAPAPGGMVVTHVVQVGGPNGSLTFSPDNVKANPGDLVQFQFHPKNHSVVQSTFDQPCIPIQNVVSNTTSAFYSGFMPTNASVGATSNVLTYTIRVTDTKPIWYYCSQGKHCQGGMVGAINAAASGNKTMSAFKALAAQASENLSPGQAAGQGSGSSPSGTGAAVPSATDAGAPSGASNAPAEQTGNTASGMYDASRQSLLGLTLGAVAALFML